MSKDRLTSFGCDLRSTVTLESLDATKEAEGTRRRPHGFGSVVKKVSRGYVDQQAFAQPASGRK
jgi:hypothetical protein